jgi:hypothetical protein
MSKSLSKAYTSEYNESARSEGVTASERYLFRLCERSFLRLWSYSGLYRDQGKTTSNSDGKELCDVFVVFENHIIIFSDKHCKFPDSGNVSIDWRRWYKSAVQSSVSQLFGAERWLRQHPERVFTDRQCAKPFPIPIPTGGTARFHKIAVARGAIDRCKKHFADEVGSLVVNMSIDSSKANQERPFQIGHQDKVRGFVHVFDDTSLAVVLEMMDTVTDFVAYLEKRERFINGGATVRAAGEEELVAYYLSNMKNESEHDFVVPSGHNSIVIDKGHWDAFKRSKRRLAQIEANRPSYAWDALIETFTTHLLNGTQRSTTGKDIAHQEQFLRFLAREGRTRRRMLAISFLDIIANTPTGNRVRIIEPSCPGDPFFVFLVVPQEDLTEDQYRDVRESLLGCYCKVLRYKRPEALDVVGLATEPGFPKVHSEDCIYLDGRYWTEEMDEHARELQAKLDILTHETRTDYGTEYEFPRVGVELDRMRGQGEVSRNKKCPCRSGRRYRNCCGKGKFDKSKWA